MISPWGSQRWPSPSDVLRRLQSYKFAQTSRTARYVETAIKVVGILTGRMGETFDVQQSISVRKLAAQSFILRVDELNNLDLEFFLALFLELTSGTHERPRVLLFDEAHVVLNRYRSNRMGLKEAPLEEAARRLRARYSSLIVCDQAPALLPPAVQANFAAVVSLRMPTYADRVFVGSAIGLNREQTEKLATLEPRVGVVSAPGYPGPVLFRVPEVSLPEAPDPDVVRREMEEIIKREFPHVPATLPWAVARAGKQSGKREAPKQSAADEILLPRNKGVKGPALNYLADQTRTPLVPLTFFDKAHGFSAGKGNSLRKALVNAGLARLMDARSSA